MQFGKQNVRRRKPNVTTLITGQYRSKLRHVIFHLCKLFSQKKTFPYPKNITFLMILMGISALVCYYNSVLNHRTA